MSYLEDFELAIQEEDFAHFLRLWEEYCLGDEVHGDELLKILKLTKNSKFGSPIGEIIETALPLWEKINDEKTAGEVLRLIIDLETTNTPQMADLSFNHLKKKYGSEENFNEKMRIVGLRSKTDFQGAITNYELLTHMKKGKFVFHTGGWGVGEIMDISFLREHVILEFEGIAALKDISFDNAFKNLEALPSDHFLARRFGDPDGLEQEGKNDPLKLIHLLLRDLGPKSAVEIKDELCGLVIPDEVWSKWWQGARAKLKKDTFVKSPESLRQPFSLREEALAHEEQFAESLTYVTSTEDLIQTTYAFIRDFPQVIKNDAGLKTTLSERLEEAMTKEKNRKDHKGIALTLELSFLLEDIFPVEFANKGAEILQSLRDPKEVIDAMEVLAFKKRALAIMKDVREDWVAKFLQLLLYAEQNYLRDYILKELLSIEGAAPLVKEKLQELIDKVSLYPESFFWYFQKIASQEEGIPLNDPKSGYLFLEAFMICLHYIEQKEGFRDLAKKMYQFLTAKRYAAFRTLIKGASVETLKEILLLASKCYSFTKQDLTIFQSLVEVVQPSLKTKEKEKEFDFDILWTTQEGFQKVQERIKQIATVETIDNAKEIEAARALGDLRENAEYKFALERRSRLQAEIKTLSKQIERARILTREDVSPKEVSVGSIVKIHDKNGQKLVYTLLGPWDADPEKKILSFQSKFAMAMLGRKKGESFNFQGEEYTIDGLQSVFD